MRLPEMVYSDRITKSKQIKFGGLNRSIGAGDGQLQDMRNLTSDHSPLLAVREPRRLYRRLNNPGGIFSWEGLCWVQGADFYFRGEKKGTVSQGQKHFASMGPWIVIMPDKCCYNVDTDTFRQMESTWTGESLTFSDGVLYEEEAAANCITCEGVDWESFFQAGDGVTISGCTQQEVNNKTIIIRQIDGDKLYFYENSFSLGNSVSYTEQGQLQIARTVPDLDFLCENENRLWGCADSTIYACKLGDIFNWNVMDGLETDAYAVDTGSAGAFTGCVSYRGYPTFFKEDHIYKVYGSTPSNFEVMGSASLGLAKGSAGSLAIAGEILFYLSPSGIMAYTGGIPQPVGAAFGTDRFRNAVGGSDGLKYYISMTDQKGQQGLYVYDTQKGLWHKEDELEVTHFARHDSNLYMLDKQGNVWIGSSYHCIEEETEAEPAVQWLAEFADHTEEEPNKKGVTKLQLRLEIEDGAAVQVWMQFDSDGIWQLVSTVAGEGAKRSYYLPIIPRRADHFRLRLTGIGSCRVHSLVYEYYKGSEHRSTRGRN